jgi:hypothetical protein
LKVEDLTNKLTGLTTKARVYMKLDSKTGRRSSIVAMAVTAAAALSTGFLPSFAQAQAKIKVAAIYTVPVEQ